MDGWMDIKTWMAEWIGKFRWMVGWKFKNGGQMIRNNRGMVGRMAIKRQLDRWLNRKNEETKQMDDKMDRREKDGRLDALLVGG